MSNSLVFLLISYMITTFLVIVEYHKKHVIFFTIYMTLNPEYMTPPKNM